MSTAGLLLDLKKLLVTLYISVFDPVTKNEAGTRSTEWRRLSQDIAAHNWFRQTQTTGSETYTTNTQTWSWQNWWGNYFLDLIIHLFTWLFLNAFFLTK